MTDLFVMAPWDENRFSVKAPDPVDNRSFLDSLTSFGSAAVSPVTALADPVQRTRFDEVFRAAEESQRLVNATNWSRQRMEQVYDETIDRVKRATGVALDNPMRATGLPLQALEAFEGNTALSTDTGVLPWEQRQKAFADKLTELRGKFPDALGDLDPNFDARALGNLAANIAEQRLAAAGDGLNPALKLAASFGGSLWGSRTDPAAVGSMLIGGGKAAAETAIGRIFGAALWGGGTNAALTAASEPSIQAGREAAGLPHGLGQAASDVAWSFGGGLVLGGGARGLAEAAPSLARIFGGKAAPADFDAVHAADAGFVDSETQSAMAHAAKVDEIGAEMRAAKPETVPDHAAPVQLVEGMRVVEDPAAPLPLVDRPVPAGTTDDLARQIVFDAPDVVTAAERLRDNEGGIVSALASDDPHVRDLGRLATLDPSLLDGIRAGDVDARHAVIVAATTDDPALQASALAALKEARPETPAEMRDLASGAVAAERSVAVEVARQGVVDDAGPAPIRVAETPAPRPAGDVLDHVLIERPDGSFERLAPDQIAKVAERETLLSDLVASCTL